MKKLLTLLAKNRRPDAAAPAARVQVNAAAREATVYLYGPIVSSASEAEWYGGVSAESFVPELRALDVDVIHLRINSPGGDVFGGQAIAQALRESKARVVAHVDGLAASAATVIATAADEIEMAAGSMYMVHRAWTFAYGNRNDLVATAELLDKIDGTLAGQYAARTGDSRDEMLAVMDAETWFTAEEAVEAKFVDRIAGDASEAPEARAQWDLSAYAKAPGRCVDQAADASAQLAATVREAVAAALRDAAQPAAAADEPTQSTEQRERQRQRLRAATLAHPID